MGFSVESLIKNFIWDMNVLKKIKTLSQAMYAHCL